jgi:hypothetical protein
MLNSSAPGKREDTEKPPVAGPPKQADIKKLLSAVKSQNKDVNDRKFYKALLGLKTGIEAYEQKPKEPKGTIDKIKYSVAIFFKHSTIENAKLELDKYSKSLSDLSTAKEKIVNQINTSLFLSTAKDVIFFFNNEVIVGEEIIPVISGSRWHLNTISANGCINQ